METKSQDSIQDDLKDLLKRCPAGTYEAALAFRQDKDVSQIVQKTLECISGALTEGKNVELRNFGVFELQVRKSRVGRNPNRPETDVIIPRRVVVKFKAGKEMKNGLKQLDLDEIDSA